MECLDAISAIGLVRPLFNQDVSTELLEIMGARRIRGIPGV